MNHTFAFLRLVFVEIDDFAVMMASVDRQIDKHFDIVVYCEQVWVSMIRSWWWWIWVINVEPTLGESHVLIFAFGPCRN